MLVRIRILKMYARTVGIYILLCFSIMRIVKNAHRQSELAIIKCLLNVETKMIILIFFFLILVYFYLLRSGFNVGLNL